MRYFITFMFFMITTSAFAKCPDIDEMKVDNSFGVEICAMPGVKQILLDHATSVMDKILDYDQDGLVDNQDVVDTLVKSGSVYVIFRSEREEDEFVEAFYEDNMDYIEEVCFPLEDERDYVGFDECIEQFGTFLAVFTNEMNTGKGWDPTIEEALHLVTHAGYAQFYYDQFGQHKDSYIAKLMDQARGGYFEKSQRRYPQGSYYTYDDSSCSYSCQITEFTYWAITSLRGQQANRKLKEIKEEWKLNTPEKMREIAPDLVAFLEDPEYKIKF
ncbi:MAG: hypothetical protein HOE17_05635 [Rhodobiaceae bacterium]|jgi:hypothetical protein|nr:hypothetical protein [Rhodobiaceae bacterium]MBT6222705.1 hypothetical protein [Rhodobiaceae bacterium]MDB4831390.1 hypothetical protein [Hyphomicrobiales bacterium]